MGSRLALVWGSEDLGFPHNSLSLALVVENGRRLAIVTCIPKGAERVRDRWTEVPKELVPWRSPSVSLKQSSCHRSLSCVYPHPGSFVLNHCVTSGQ